MAIRELPKYESTRDDYIYVENVAYFAQMLSNSTLIAVDTETYYDPALKPPAAITKFIKGSPNNRPFGVSIYDGERGYWIDHDLIELKPLLENSSIAKVLHNSKYDMQMLRNIGIQLDGEIWDTMLLIQLIDEEFMCKTPDGLFKKSKRLKDLAFHFLGNDAHELEDLVADYRKILASNQGLATSNISYKDVSDANPILMKDYAIADTEFTYKLYHIFKPMLIEQDLLRAYEVDMNATRAVVEVERTGFRVDVERMKADELSLTKIIGERTRSVFDCSGYSFNINSDAELITAFDKLGVTWQHFTDKGEYSTDKWVMKFYTKSPDERIARMAAAVLDYRKAEKILSTYITGVYPLIQGDGKVHPDYWVSPDDYDRGGTKTGRLSSSNPNLQNITKKPVSLEEDEYGE
jgi:DNA polymerase-1